MASAVPHQDLLRLCVQELFVGENIVTNVRKEADIINPSTGLFLELDIWIPNLKICFEFQDMHHYDTTWYSQMPIADIKYHDQYKNEYIQQRADSLVVVPFWWDGTPEILATNIHFHRPDLLAHFSHFPMMALNPSREHLRYGNVPNVGQLMLASFPSSPFFQSSVSVDNSWWLGEKYDGLRIVWNPVTKTLYGRSGVPIRLPAHRFVTHIFIDGEIWFGRGGFAEAQKILFHGYDDVDWILMRLIAFDDPSPWMNKEPFERRYAQILTAVESDHPFLVTASRTLCTDPKLIALSERHILGDGGEGIILRLPCSFYHHGRSTSLLKWKASTADTEALVISTGSTYTLMLLDGTMFEIQQKDIKPELTLANGNVVTFSYNMFSRRAVPVDPFVYRVRHDLQWENLVLQEKAAVFTSKPHGYWTGEKGSKMRSVLEQFARDNQFEPLVAENWYPYSPVSFAHYPDANYVFSHFKGSFVSALVTLFPELALDEGKFVTLKKNFWQNNENRRRVFQDLAQELGFDPLLPENWYSTSSEAIKASPKVNSILTSYYGGSIIRGIKHLFPEIGLDARKFPFSPHNYWDDEINRKKYFENLACKKGIDPLLPEDWYSLDYQEILNKKSIHSLLSFYEGSYVKALMELFPDIGLDPARFNYLGPLLEFSANTKQYFIDYAKYNKFDPLVPSNWYTVSDTDFTNSKDGKVILSRYGNNLPKALIHAFPNIDFNKRKFSGIPRNWGDTKNRRAFFEEIAKENLFDPLIAENWYSRDPSILMTSKTTRSVVSYHDGKWECALLDLFPEIKMEAHRFKFAHRDFWREARNRKNLFLDFAEKNGFNPLVASNWYSVDEEKLLAYKDIINMLYYHRGSVAKAISELFHDISFDPSKFKSEYNTTWIYAKNRRYFFTSFARENKFDPLTPSNWYPITNDLVIPYKGGNAILAYYNGNVQKALLALYPEIGLDPLHFSLLPRGYWLDKNNQKQVFEELAKDFDPLVPIHWYSITQQDIQQMKGGNAVLCIYKGSVPQALLTLFPNIGLVEEYFYFRGNANIIRARKKFFQFAKDNGFDPLLPSSWYSLDPQVLINAKGMQTLLIDYNGNVGKALISLFPEIGLKSSMLDQISQAPSSTPRNSWLYEPNRKKLFLDFAAENNFDPQVLSNWDAVNWDDFLSKKGAGAVLFYYKGNTKKALQALFAS